MLPLCRSTSTSSQSTTYPSTIVASIASKLSLFTPIDIRQTSFSDMTTMYELLKTQYFLPYYSQYPSACFAPGDLVRFNAINVALSHYDRRPAFDHRAPWPFLKVATKCEVWSVEVILAAMVGIRVLCGDEETSMHAEKEIEFLIRLQLRLSSMQGGSSDPGSDTSSEYSCTS